MEDSIAESVLLDNFKSFGAGGFGGICAVITGQPFDYTKVLLQTNQYKSSLDCIKGTLASGGPLGFYKGVSSPLLGVTPMFAVSFWGYDVGKKLVCTFYNIDPVKSHLTIPQISAAGFFSAIPTTLIAAPFERVKVVMQTSQGQVSFVETVSKLALQTRWSEINLQGVRGYFGQGRAWICGLLCHLRIPKKGALWKL